MKTRRLLALLPATAVAACAAALPSLSRRAAAGTTPPPQYGRIPLAFEANQGQTDARVRYLSRGPGYSLFLTPTEAVLSLARPSKTAGAAVQRRPPAPAKPAAASVVKMRLVGGNPKAAVTGEQALPGRANYLRGSDPKKWRTNVPTYGKVRYAGAYPGIDLVYYGSQRQLEYDFVVAPGADPGRIELEFAGADRVLVDPGGDLVLAMPGGELRQQRPVIYQEVDGERREVAGGYVLRPTAPGRSSARVGFQVARYDAARPLVIDPVLVYSTYLGGSSAESGYGIAVDSTGCAYITGQTQSSDFPTTPGTVDRTFSGGQVEAFVTRLNPEGSAILYSTYLGGNNWSYGKGIAVDDAGSAYVTGGTRFTTTFPTTPGAFDTTPDGSYDAFVAKLDPSGASLAYCTFLGGSTVEDGNAIVVDFAGNAYIAGTTQSPDYPRTPGTVSGGGGGVFVTKLNPAGSGLVYSAVFGFASNGLGDLAVDGLGRAYVTAGGGIPTTPGAFDTTENGQVDVWVARLNATATALDYATYIGGSADEYSHGLAVDSTGAAYVAGETTSASFPTTPDALDTTYGGERDGFLLKLNASGSALVYSTFLGGSATDIARGVVIDGQGSAYVTGDTDSTGFPVTAGALSPNLRGGRDVFVTWVNPAGTAALYSTYLGGIRSDEAYAVALGPGRGVYLTGITGSPDFPITSGAHDAVLNQGEVFVTRLDLTSFADIIPPVLICPANVTASTDAGACSARVSYPAPRATDENPGVIVTSAPPSGSVFPVGATSVLCTARDSSGNTSACSFTVTVRDTQPPALTLPAGRSLTTDPGKCTVALSPGTATTADNCPGVTLAGVRSDGKPLADPYPAGATTITWTATDAAGNVTAGTQTIAVTDGERPVLSCPPNRAAPTDPGQCTAALAVSPATATDNCPDLTVTALRSDGQPLGAPFPASTTSITWTAADRSGNTAVCSQSVTVTDSEPPRLTVPPDVSRGTDPGRCSAALSAGAASGTDNCPGVAVQGTRSDGQPLGAAYPAGVTTITWTATDAAGNTVSATQTVTVTDAEGPRITCPPDRSVATDPGRCTAAVAAGRAAASDNCPGLTLSGARSDGQALGSPFAVGVTTVTWSATDAAGSSAACTQTITVRDTEAPQVGCPPLRSLSTDPGRCTAALPENAAAVSDNCPGVTFSGVRSDGQPQEAPYPVGVTRITWTAVDAAGNRASCMQAILVKDPEAPSAACLPSQSVSTDPGRCTAAVTAGAATVTDNCPGARVSGVRSDGQALGAPYPVGATTITWTAVDASGNRASCTQTITVNDTEAPKPTCPPSRSESTDPGRCTAAVTAGAGTARDNCPGAGISGARSDGQALGALYPVGVTTITWTATDAAGNRASCTQTILVRDTEAPVITCPRTVAAGAATATDNCPGVTVAGVRSDGRPLGAPFPRGITRITWTATDAAGNRSSCTQIYRRPRR